MKQQQQGDGLRGERSEETISTRRDGDHSAVNVTAGQRSRQRADRTHISVHVALCLEQSGTHWSVSSHYDLH